MSLRQAVDGARILVVCGAGGVGKTSVAAALAVRSAREGRRTIVLAVDPSRRLATSLGLPREPGVRRTVDLGDGASLDALLLDTKRTFDELVERHAGSPERRDRILENRFYRRITDTLSGTHEYMAMERLYELATGEGYDSIVIDTPPTRSALSFLDAPRRMTDFLGGRVLRWLLWPYRRAGMAGLRGASLGARMLARTIGKVAGAEVLADTAEFLGAFEGMYDGFRRRAEAVTALLSEPRTVFVVVAAPEPESLGEAGGFVERLDRNGMHLAGVVVNRVRSAPPLPEGATSEALARLEQGDQTDRALAASLAVARRLDATERSQRAAVDRFRRSVPDAAVTLVPEQPSDVHDLAGLEGLRDALVG